MQNRTIRFLHISDTHFGVYYAVQPRNMLRKAYGDLFFQKVRDVIQTAVIKYKVDFIIHCGDFFNRSKPPPKVIDRAVKPFIFAANCGVPIYLLPGNHDRSKLRLGLLPFHDNINLFIKPTSFYFEKSGIRIRICGFPFNRFNTSLKFRNIFEKSWNNSQEIQKSQDFSILLLHQLIEGSKIEYHTFWTGHNVIPFNTLPKFINYVACGHVHRFQFLSSLQKPTGRFTLKSINTLHSIYQERQSSLQCSKQINNNLLHQTPVVAYCGSLERVSMAEKNEPKGFIIGTLFLSKDGKAINRVEYDFHILPSIKMIFQVWELNRDNISDCIEKTLEYLGDLKNDGNPEPILNNIKLNSVCRIKIEGIERLSLDQQMEIRAFKKKMKKLNVYLTFTYKNENWIKNF